MNIFSSLFNAAVFCCAAAVYLCAGHAGAADNKTPEPHLVFKKSAVIKKYKKGNVHAEPYRVNRGEHLWKILREHYRLSNAKIAVYCKVAGEVNPDIDNIHEIYPDQRILLPFKYTLTEPATDNATGVGGSPLRHVVERGEHLAHILRTRYGLQDTVIFSRLATALILDANPGLVDVNDLEVGQELVIPPEIFVLQEAVKQGAVPEEKLVQMKKPVEKSLKKEDSGQRHAVAAVKKPPPEHQADRVRKKQQEAVKKPFPKKKAEPKTVQKNVSEHKTVELSEEEMQIKKMLTSFTRSFNGRDNSTGTEVFPIDERGSVALDYSRFPVYSFPWGKKVLFDYGSRLPAGVRDIVGSHWENAEIVSVTEKDDMESILGKVLDVCGFYKVEKNGEYIMNRDDIQISVSGSWIVFKDATLKKAFVVNLVTDPNQALNPDLKRYLHERGLSIVDVGRHPVSGGQLSEADPGRNASVHSIAGESSALVDSVLGILGYDFKKDHPTQIFQNMYSGFSLEIIADRMFKRDDALYVIDFHNLPERICRIITEQGVHLLQIQGQEAGQPEGIKQLLDFCGASYQGPSVRFRYGGDGTTTVKLTVPGFLIDRQNNDVLLTGMDLDASVADLLAEKNIAIIRY